LAIKDTLELINRMQADGVIGNYAIAGAVAATFYIEPSATLDIDILVDVDLARTPESSLISLAPIYEYLRNLGAKIEGEHITVGDWPVQFLPAADDLDREALSAANTTDVDGVPTRVLRAEHVVAIALRTGRPKDHARIIQFIENRKLDPETLDAVLSRYKLSSKWAEFKRRFD
jgi:hypothetical protein